MIMDVNENSTDELLVDINVRSVSILWSALGPIRDPRTRIHWLNVLTRSSTPNALETDNLQTKADQILELLGYYKQDLTETPDAMHDTEILV